MEFNSDKDILEVLQNGIFHSYFSPAVIYPDGTEYWYIHGLLHRKDGPAVTMANGAKYWYKFGKLHRIDGPAVMAKNNTLWYVEGELCSTPAEFQLSARLTDYQMYLIFMEFGKLM